MCKTGWLPDILQANKCISVCFQQPNFLYSDAEKNIIQSLEIHDDRQNLSEDHRIILNKIYSWLPLETSDRLDLFVFGNLSYDEIAQIKETHILKLKR